MAGSGEAKDCAPALHAERCSLPVADPQAWRIHGRLSQRRQQRLIYHLINNSL
jgi:hypothetical protein